MKRVLVSVRDAAEAKVALACGVDLIDVKEPNRGALGAADPEVWQEVLSTVDGRVPVSIALGELTSWSSQNQIAPGVKYAKLGMAGASELPDWQTRWRDVMRSLPPGCLPVAVIYADWEAAQAPRPDEILVAATQARCAAILMDTFAKHQDGVYHTLSGSAIDALLKRARDAGLMTVLGGGLTWESLKLALASPAEFLAFRGLACGGTRTSSIDPQACERLVQVVHGPHVA